MNEKERLISAITESFEASTLKKAVLSSPRSKSCGVRKIEIRPVSIRNAAQIQLTEFRADGKAAASNLPASEAADKLCSMLGGEFRQLDIVTTAGSCTALANSKGGVHISDNISSGGEKAEFGGNDAEKNRVLSGGEPFLRLLGISDDKGRVFDRRQAKFRQISRFLELVRDVEDRLPSPPEPLYILDLCCGKSYLTFAIYHYFTAMRGRTLRMTGVDLKPDVVRYCSSCAGQLGWEGLDFVCGDILRFEPERQPDMVVSLHACDIATDITLACAVRHKAKVILSTPCCQHEMANQLECGDLGFITSKPLLRHKMTDAFTDALRLSRLECENYSCEALELVDPEETPKNIMLRCVLRDSVMSAEKRDKLYAEYLRVCRWLHVDPYLDRLLGGNAEEKIFISAKMTAER